MKTLTITGGPSPTTVKILDSEGRDITGEILRYDLVGDPTKELLTLDLRMLAKFEDHKVIENVGSFRHDLERVINAHSKENGSDTPDYVLAEFLIGCLAAFDQAVRIRDEAKEWAKE